MLEVGSGLHPEFSGRENIDASLGLLGLSRKEIAAATEDIADFTELGRFLDQPFKTYSLGMQARLGIGIATTVRPEILIIDEILGAGDAYFFAKSTARMQQLLSEGASVLLVSHALDQIARFCDETIWLDRGRIVMRGQTTEVVKAYERFTRDLDDRRLRAKNRKTKGFDAFERDSYTAAFDVRLATTAEAGCEVTSIELLRDGAVEDPSTSVTPRMPTGASPPTSSLRKAEAVGPRWRPIPTARTSGGSARAAWRSPCSMSGSSIPTRPTRSAFAPERRRARVARRVPG